MRYRFRVGLGDVVPERGGAPAGTVAIGGDGLSQFASSKPRGIIYTPCGPDGKLSRTLPKAVPRMVGTSGAGLVIVLGDTSITAYRQPR